MTLRARGAACVVAVAWLCGCREVWQLDDAVFADAGAEAAGTTGTAAACPDAGVLFADDFESGEFGAEWRWETDQPWSVLEIPPTLGEYSAGSAGDGDASELVLVLAGLPAGARLRYDMMIGDGQLSFSIDEIIQHKWDGTPWQRYTSPPLDAGTHRFTFRHEGDVVFKWDEARSRIDNIEVTPPCPGD